MKKPARAHWILEDRHLTKKGYLFILFVNYTCWGENNVLGDLPDLNDVKRTESAQASSLPRFVSHGASCMQPVPRTTNINFTIVHKFDIFRRCNIKGTFCCIPRCSRRSGKQKWKVPVENIGGKRELVKSRILFFPEGLRSGYCFSNTDILLERWSRGTFARITWSTFYDIKHHTSPDACTVVSYACRRSLDSLQKIYCVTKEVTCTAIYW